MKILAQAERIYLRELTPDDWPAVFAYAGDPEVTAFQTWPTHSEQASKDWVHSAVAAQQTGPRKDFYWAVCLKDEDVVIGGIGVHRGFPAENLQSAEIGCSIAKARWGHGYGREALGLAMLYTFAKTDIYRLVAYCRETHLASIKLAQHFGFRQEGHFIQDVVIQGRKMNSLAFGILKAEVRPARRSR